jgi:hypothetical protein
MKLRSQETVKALEHAQLIEQAKLEKEQAYTFPSPAYRTQLCPVHLLQRIPSHLLHSYPRPSRTVFANQGPRVGTPRPCAHRPPPADVHGLQEEDLLFKQGNRALLEQRAQRAVFPSSNP